MAESAENFLTRRGMAFLLFAMGCLIWGCLFHGVHYYWQGNSTYNFGWFVPLFAGWFLYRQMQETRFREADSPGRWRLPLIGAILLAGVILAGGLSLFHEAVPFWRRPLWMHALVLLAVSLGLLFITTGWRGLRTFGFPFCFLLLALPWPTRLEAALIEPLTGWVVDATVLVLIVAGYPAIEMGNTIHVGQTVVGVDEACSGIRSLQALVMMALFFGEMYRFGAWRRLALIASAFFLAIFFNGIRAVSLTLIRIHGTQGQFDQWHDLFGNFNAIAATAVLVGAAEVIATLYRRPAREAPVLTCYLPGRRAFMITMALAAAGFFLADLGAKGYFEWMEGRRAAPLPALQLQWPDEPGLQHRVTEIPEQTADILKYDFGSQVELRWANGTRAVLVHYGYDGKGGGRVVDSYFHSPMNCMPATGARQVGSSRSFPVSLYGAQTAVEQFEFVYGDPLNPRPIHVFWLIWEPNQSGLGGFRQAGLRTPATWEWTWQMIQNGVRERTPEVLLVYFFSEASAEAMRRQFNELLETIVIEPPSTELLRSAD